MFMGVYVGHGSRTECLEEEPSAAAPFEMYIHRKERDVGQKTGLLTYLLTYLLTPWCRVLL